MKKTLALFLALTMICSVLVGCANNGDEASDPGNSNSITSQAPGNETPSGDKTVVNISVGDGDPGTLDPFTGTGSSFVQSTMQLYDRMLDMDENGEIVPSLAESYKREGDTLIFKLRENIVDTAGNSFTSEDAVWCFEMWNEKGYTNAAAFGNPTVIDAYSFSVDIVNESVTTLNQFTDLCFVTKAAYEACGNNMATTVISTGPYMVEDYTTGSTLTLVKNENYWQDKPTVPNQMQNVDKIVYNYMTEASQIVINLESGIVDFAFVDWTVSGRFSDGTAGGKFNINEVQGWGGNDLYFNMSDQSIFKDNPDLRKAILYAIDNQAIVDAVWGGHAQVPKAMGNYNYPDADPAWQNEDYFDYDPELSKDYFDKSGYSAGELSLRLIYPQSSYTDNMAEIIHGYLGALGISVEIMGLENAIYNEYYLDPSQYDLLINGGGGGGSITRIWNNKLNKASFGGETANAFIDDDTLQELVLAAINPDTHSQETVNAVHYYMKEAAYLKRLYIEYKCCVTNGDKIVTPFINTDSRPVPGAFTYIWNS